MGLFDIRSKKTAEQYFAEGRNFINLGQYIKALTSYDNGLATDSKNALAWNNRGSILGKLGRFTEAVDSYDKAIAINPDYAGAWFNRGIALGELGRYADSVTSYDKGLALNPNNAVGWYNRGANLAKLNKYAEAASSFDKAISINPHDSETWSKRGYVLTVASSSAFLNKVIATTDPKSFDEVAWNKIVQEYVRQNSEGVASYDKAIALNSDYAEAWAGRGITLGMIGRCTEALASYDKAIALNPEYADTESKRGFTKAIASGVSYLNQKLEINPNDVDAINNRRVGLEMLEKYT